MIILMNNSDLATEDEMRQKFNMTHIKKQASDCPAAIYESSKHPRLIPNKREPAGMLSFMVKNQTFFITPI